MKGLLIKDFRLMKSQGAVLLVTIILIAVLMGTIGDMSPSFAVIYITMLLTMFAVTTISYDEFDNGYLFLMTLPITRKKYVNEKYIFGILVSLGAWCIGMASGTVQLILEHRAFSWTDWVGSGIMYIFITWIFLGIMLPLRLRFDAEQSRYANIIVIGIIIGAGIALSKLSGYMPEAICKAAGSFLKSLGDNGIVIITAAAAAAALFISYMCSRRIMTEKEF